MVSTIKSRKCTSNGVKLPKFLWLLSKTTTIKSNNNIIFQAGIQNHKPFHTFLIFVSKSSNLIVVLLIEQTHIKIIFFDKEKPDRFSSKPSFQVFPTFKRRNHTNSRNFGFSFRCSFVAAHHPNNYQNSMAITLKCASLHL